jgi:hypothetical protein
MHALRTTAAVLDGRSRGARFFCSLCFLDYGTVAAVG